MSNLPKKAEDKVNVFGIVLIGIASTILIWASAVALQAYYMNTAGPKEIERDQINLADERRAVEAEQQGRLVRLEHNDAFGDVSCVSNPIDVAMTAVVGAAQDKDAKTLVPALGPGADGSYYKPTIAPIVGYPSEATGNAPQPAGPTAEVTSTPEGDIVATSAPIEVGTDGKLAPGSGQVVAAVAALMADDASIEEVTINAYTDTGRAPVAADEITQARADAVLARLVAAGVAPTRLRAVGNGSADPVGDNATSEGREANNRIVLVISQRGEVAPDPDQPDQPQPDQPEPEQPQPDQPDTPTPTPTPAPANP